MYQSERGIRPFFKGFYLSTTAMMMSSGIYFYSYNQCKTMFGDDNGDKLGIFSAGISASTYV